MDLPESEQLAGAGQVVAVRGDGDERPTGVMRLLERRGPGWRQVGEELRVALGARGLAWAGGLLPASENRWRLPAKRDGDGRSPCGLFRLSFAFGMAGSLEVNPGWPYLPLHQGYVLVDDPASLYYNCVVDRRLVAAPDWRSARAMVDAEGRHRLGLVVEQNLYPAVAGAGAGTFLQLAVAGEAGTSGGTALPEERMLELLRFLDPARSPLLLQLPS